MSESFSVQGPVRIPRTAEHHKIGYQDSYRHKKEQQDDPQKSPFQKLMKKEEASGKDTTITPEQIFDRILPRCLIYITDYDKIPRLFHKEYPLDIFFRKEIRESDLREPEYLKETNDNSREWKEMLRHCRGNIVLVHPLQWSKMKADPGYAVMLVTEVRSVLAQEYAQAGTQSDGACLSCVAGIDESGLSVCLFSTGERFKRVRITPEKLSKLRKQRRKISDIERKQEFIEKLRRQKKGLEKYRYDTAVMNRVKMTAKLFDPAAIRIPENEKDRPAILTEDEITLSLMELITGGL